MWQMMGLKVCTKCKETKQVTDFYRNQVHCKACAKTSNKNYRELNKHKIRLRKKAYREANKSSIAQKHAIYKRLNAKKINSLNAERAARKLMATPGWLTDLDRVHIELFYSAAVDQKQYGLNCHVDHIIPLQSKEVCGLHVPWNLQILPASENIKKGNRLK